MSGATETAASADATVVRVRDDPMGRLGLLRQMYRFPTMIDREPMVAGGASATPTHWYPRHTWH